MHLNISTLRNNFAGKREFQGMHAPKHHDSIGLIHVTSLGDWIKNSVLSVGTNKLLLKNCYFEGGEKVNKKAWCETNDSAVRVATATWSPELLTLKETR